MPGTRPRLTIDRSTAAAGAPFFRLHGTGGGAACRNVAGRLRVQNARDQMLRVAADYERMARDAEQREIAQGLSYLRALVVRQRHGQQAA